MGEAHHEGLPVLRGDDPRRGHPLPILPERPERPSRRRPQRHPALYLLILAGILLYAVAALIVRKTIKLQVCLCEEHARRRAKKIMTGWAIFSLSIVLMVVSGTAQFWPGFVLSWLLLFTGLIWAVSALPVLRPQKIDDKTGWLKAAGPAFLDSLPEKS